jgi:hypothetical protein
VHVRNEFAKTEFRFNKDKGIIFDILNHPLIELLENLDIVMGIQLFSYLIPYLAIDKLEENTLQIVGFDGKYFQIKDTCSFNTFPSIIVNNPLSRAIAGYILSLPVENQYHLINFTYVNGTILGYDTSYNLRIQNNGDKSYEYFDRPWFTFDKRIIKNGYVIYYHDGYIIRMSRLVKTIESPEFEYNCQLISFSIISSSYALKYNRMGVKSVLLDFDEFSKACWDITLVGIRFCFAKLSTQLVSFEIEDFK